MKKYVEFLKTELAKSLVEIIIKKIEPERIINAKTKKLTYEIHGYIIMGKNADDYTKSMQVLINNL